MLSLIIILLPFLGTSLGSAAVFFCKNDLSENTKKSHFGFAAGVMIAASIWSLLLPSIEMATKQKTLSWIPAATGFVIGICFLLITESLATYLTNKSNKADKIKSVRNDFMLFLAVTLHNIPEGMAVGVACAGMLGSDSGITVAAALALSFGISVQNFPEGSIISMTLHSSGFKKGKSFVLGVLSGVVEPIAAVLTVVFVSKIIVLLPYLLSFAAGAMFYVTVEDLIPECRKDSKSGMAAIFCTAGFLLMMVLDIVFG